jgi:cardiolipin synthase A/B
VPTSPPPNAPATTRRGLSWKKVLRPFAGRRLPRALRAEHVHRLAEAQCQGLEDPGFARLLGKIDGREPYGGNQIEVYFRGAEAFAAMAQAIVGADREILLESYIFSDDEIGHDIFEALASARLRGVVVKVLVDAVGSAATRRSFWRHMASHGIDVRRYRPLQPDFLRHPFRDHRKILVVDRSVAFTGGMNIAEEYGSARPSLGAPWRDSHVRASGPVARELAAVFAESWEQAQGESLTIEPFLEPEIATGAQVMVLESRPNRGHAESAAVFAAIVAAARHYVYVTNAYFAPKRIALEVLGRAAANGVDVRLLLPGLTDVPLVRHAGHGFFQGLLDQGVRIFEYQASVLHAKSLVADDHVSLVGSTNLDFRSFTFNGECNLVVLDRRVAEAMHRAFDDDLESALEIDRQAWRRRSLPHKVGDRLARALAPLL